MRIVWLILNVAFGLIPSVLFFAWVERNCSLPVLPIELGWPWISLDLEPAAACAWNAMLVLAFGFIHSLLAQAPAQRALDRLAGAAATRTVYILVTGLSLFALMGAWQHTGVTVWQLPLPPIAQNIVSIALFLGFLGGAHTAMSR